jgi:hypothetical protein
MGNVPPNKDDFLNFPHASIHSSSRQVRSSEQTFSPLVGTKWGDVLQETWNPVCIISLFLKRRLY